MAGVTLHPLQWVVAILLVATTQVWCAPYLKTAPGQVGDQQPPLDHLFSPDQGLIGPLFRQNDYSVDPPTMGGCYYQFRPYDEGDRIITNEPCLNCTCHNSMLMCYLKVCPFSKPIGQDCTIEKDPNQCCPVITCPQVPVGLEVMPETALTTTTKSPASTAVVPYTKHGCTIADEFYPDGAQVPGDPKNPCELCYCIRNHTACLMQECTLKIEGCTPVFEDAICCPVRYMCEYDEEELLQITTTEVSVNETIITTLPPHIGGCTHNSEFYADGSQIPSEDPCEHCYCMKTDIVCAIQECRSPLDEDDENCVPRLPLPGKCCPEAYDCHVDQLSENVTSVVERPDLVDLQTRERQHRLEDATTDETTTIPTESTTDTYSPFGIEPVVGTEQPAVVEDKEVVPIEPVDETTLKYVTAEIVTVTKRPEVLITTDKATVPEEAATETTEDEKVVTDATEIPTIIEETTRMSTMTPEVSDKEIEEGVAEITKSTDSDSDILETRTTGPDDEMFLTTTPMSDETTLRPETDAVKEIAMPTITAFKPDEKVTEPTPKPDDISETDVEFDADATPEPKEPATDVTTITDEKEVVTEKIVSIETTLLPVDTLETTTAKEEELIEETTTSKKIEPVDVTTTKAPIVSEETTTEEVEAITDVPIKELSTESTTAYEKPEISDITTLSPEVLLETTSPKEKDITEISMETTTTEKHVDVISEVTESPVAVVTDIETIPEVTDIVEVTTISAIEPVTGVVDPKIQPTKTEKPVVAPVDGKCLSNETIYEEGELVPIVNACQENCICTSGVVTCQQIACPSPPPTFLRCDTQKNPKECCPQYECPMIQPDPVPSPNCISNENQYLEGEYVPSPDSCTDCYCLYGEIICAYQECPEVEPGCKPLEIPEGSCCPAKYECPAMEILDLTLTTMPSVVVSEVTATTYPPKELPEVEVTSTEPTDVPELGAATTPSEIPVDFTEKPVDITEKPLDVTEKPLDVTEKPLDVTEKPLDVTEKPVDTTEKPVDITEKPVDITEKPVDEISTIIPDVTKEIEEVTPEVVTEKEITEAPTEVTFTPEVIAIEPETTTAAVDETPIEQDSMTTEAELDVEVTTAHPVEEVEPSTVTPSKEITAPEVDEEVTLIPDTTTKLTITDELETTTAVPLVKETTVKPLEAVTDPVIVSVEEIYEDAEDIATPTEPADILEAATTPEYKTTKEDEVVTTEPSVDITTVEYDTEKTTSEIEVDTTLPDEVTESTVPSKEKEVTDAALLTTTELPDDKEVEVAPTTEVSEETTEMPAKTTTIHDELIEPVTTPSAVEVPDDVELTTIDPDIEVTTILTYTETSTEAIVQPDDIKIETSIPVITTESSVEYSPATDTTEFIDEVTTIVSVETTEPVTDSVFEESTDDVTDKPATPTPETLLFTSSVMETTVLPKITDEITTVVPIVEFISETTKAVETTTDEVITEYLPPSSKRPDSDLATTMVPTIEGCWWFDNNVYEHGDAVPSENACQENCTCTNGIVKCQHKACPPAPPAFLRCTETSSNDSCCPTFECAPSPTTLKCEHNGQVFEDNEYIPSDTLCQDCFCLSGEVVCAELVCGVPRMNCETAVQKENECCPSIYECVETTLPDVTTALPEEEPKATDIIATDEDEVVMTVPTVDIYEKTTKLPEKLPEIEMTTVYSDKIQDIEDDQPEEPEVGIDDYTEGPTPSIVATTLPADTTTDTIEDVILTTAISPPAESELTTLTTEAIESMTTEEAVLPDIIVETTTSKEVTATELETATSEEIEPVDVTTEAILTEDILTVGVETITDAPIIESTTDVPIKPDEKEIVTEDIVSKETTLSPIDTMKTTTEKEEELIEETTTSVKIETVDLTITKAPIVAEETTTEEVEATTADVPIKELPTETTTPDEKPEISDITTLSPEVLLETTSPKEEDITEISMETTVTEKHVGVISEVTESPVAVVTDIETIPEVTDIVEVTTISAIEPVTGVVDPKIQPTKTEKPVVAPVDGKCLSNETIYEEGELVPIVNACQENCICTSGVVTCQQIACPSPPPTFLRCDTQKNPKECCPQYECPMIQPDPVPSPNCISNENQYLEGEYVPSPDSCTDCYCLYGEIICAYQECPEVEPGCKPLEIPEGSCCPAKYECPAIEILDLTLTTMPSVVVSEVTATTYPPKELPEVEVTSTEPTDVPELDAATTPSEIPVDFTEKPVDITEKPLDVTEKPLDVTEKPLDVTEKPLDVTEKPVDITEIPVDFTEKPVDITEKPVDEISTVIPDVTKEIEEVTPEVVTEKEITEAPTEVTFTPEVIAIEPETTTATVDETPIEQDSITTVAELDVEVTTAHPVEEVEPSTVTPSKEITTPEVDEEVTLIPDTTTKLTITDELETTPAVPLVKETTVKPVEDVTDPVIVSVEEIHEDAEDIATPTEPADILEAATTPEYETTKEDEVVTTEPSVDITTVEYDTKKTTSEIKVDTTLPDEVTESTVPSKETEVTDAALLTTTELPDDKEVEVAPTTEVSEETTEIPAKTTTIYEELIEPVTTPIIVEVSDKVELTTVEPEIDVTTTATKLEIELTTTSEEIAETSIAPKVVATATDIPEIELFDLTTVSKIPEEDKVTTESIDEPEVTTVKTLIDEVTDKTLEVVTDSPLDITTITEKITTEDDHTSPEVDIDAVAILTTTEIPAEITTIETSEVPTEKSTELPIEIIITTPTSEVPTEKSTDLLVEITTTTTQVLPDIEETTHSVETDTTIVPYFEGCWWFDNNLYEHGEPVPSDNSCQENCRCINGTVRCQYKACPPAPPTFLRCAETFNNDSCCTTYECAPLPTNLQCMHQGKIYADGDYVPSDTLCFDCYCVEGEVICADLVCGVPRSDCDAIMQRADECCPTNYECNEMVSLDLFTNTTTAAEEIELTTTVTTTTTSTTSTVEGIIEPKIKNETTVEVTPSPEVVTVGIEDDEETLPEVPEKVPDAETDTQYIPPTTVSPNETTTWTPTTTTELVIGPGSCLFNGKVYVSAQQIPRDDPCDFCFCFRGDIICLQQTCPPPIPGCYEEAISGFCCPRYECPVKQSVIEITTTTTPFPSFPPQYKTSRETVCEVDGLHYPVGQVIPEASSPCHECICGKDGFMKCLPKECDSHRKLTIHGYR